MPNAFDQTDHFDVGLDTYTRPGFRADIDVGLQLMLKGDQNEYSSGWSMRIELGGGPGARPYREEIVGCPDYVKTIGIYDGDPPCLRRLTDVREEEGCVGVEPGVAQGPTDQLGVQELLDMDRPATWDTTTNTIDGGCTDAGDCRQHNPTGANISPRVIALALFDPQACATASCTTGNNTVAQVVNIMGFSRRHVQRRLPGSGHATGLVRHGPRGGQNGRRPPDELSRADSRRHGVGWARKLSQGRPADSMTRKAELVAAVFLVAELLIVAGHWPRAKEVYRTVYQTLWSWAPVLDTSEAFR